MKRSNCSTNMKCNKRGFFDIPEPFRKLSLDEKRKLIWNKEYPNCANIANKYDMLGQLGQGTYGVVYKACEKNTKKVVALKKILPNTEYGGMPLTAIREIRLLQQLKHDNIICFLEVCKADLPGPKGPAIFYIALEYCEVSLEAILKEKQLSLTSGAKKTIVKHLLKGLDFMHKNFILHRDIKAANLLITPTGILKIADFGMARPVHKSCANVQQIFSGCVVTLWYRAPELLLGERAYTSAIDIWSAGCVMAELWTRSAIVNGSTEQEQLLLILKLCGSITKESWPNVEKLPLYGNVELPTNCKRRIRELLSKVLIDVNAVSLIDKILVLDPQKRIDADTALKHKFFWSEPLPEPLKPLIALYRNIQAQAKTMIKKDPYDGYVEHIF